MKRNIIAMLFLFLPSIAFAGNWFRDVGDKLGRGIVTDATGIDVNRREPPPQYVVEQAPPTVVIEAPPVVIEEPPAMVIEEPPQLIYAPALGYYVAVGATHEMVFINNAYYINRHGNWFVSSSYAGPWVATQRRNIPESLRRHNWAQIRQYRDHEYNNYRRDPSHYQGRFYEHRAAEHRAEQQAERRMERRVEKRVEQKMERRAEQQHEIRMENRAEQRGEKRIEQRRIVKQENNVTVQHKPVIAANAPKPSAAGLKHAVPKDGHTKDNNNEKEK